MFALVRKAINSNKVADSMSSTFKEFNLESSTWVTTMSTKGAYLLEKN